MNIIIRPAREGDIPRMAGLLGELFRIEQDFSPDREKQATGLSALLNDPSGRCRVFVAEAAGVVVGMATVQTVLSTAEGGQTGLVEDVIVDERFRCRSVGTALVEAIVAWSRERGFTRLQLLADRENHQALNFYASRGWTATRLICMHAHP